jgi:hypothetical protein
MCQEFLRFLWNRQLHYIVHRNVQLDPFLRYLTLFPHCYALECKINFNIILIFGVETVKGGRRIWLATLPPSVSRLSRRCGSLDIYGLLQG